MNIYLLTRKSVHGWDEYDSFAVAATTAREARKITMAAAGEWDHCDWTKPAAATCRKIGTARPGIKAEVIVSSFNAG